MEVMMLPLRLATILGLTLLNRRCWTGSVYLVGNTATIISRGIGEFQQPHLSENKAYARYAARMKTDLGVTGATIARGWNAVSSIAGCCSA